MAQNRGGQNFPGAESLLGFFAGLPNPEKLFKEIQRMNDNMERIQPDISKLANSPLMNLTPQDVRNLTTAMQGVEVPKIILSLNEATSTIKALYKKLWGNV